MVILMLNPRINRRNDEEFPYRSPNKIDQSPTEIDILFFRVQSPWQDNQYRMHERRPQTYLLESAYKAYKVLYDSLEQKYSPLEQKYKLFEELIKQGDNTSKQEDNSLEQVNNPSERAENPLEQVYSPSEQAYNEMHSGRREIAPTSEQGGTHNMEDGYKRLLDRLDQDIRDHRKEIAERDAQLRAEMREREERIIKALESTLTQQKELLMSHKELIDSKITNIDIKLNNIHEDFKQLREDFKELGTDFTQHKMEIEGKMNNLYIFVASTFIAVVALAVTILFGMNDRIVDMIKELADLKAQIGK